jgi:hypothetical protein
MLVVDQLAHLAPSANHMPPPLTRDTVSSILEPPTLSSWILPPVIVLRKLSFQNNSCTTRRQLWSRLTTLRPGRNHNRIAIHAAQWLAWTVTSMQAKLNAAFEVLDVVAAS